MGHHAHNHHGDHPLRTVFNAQRMKHARQLLEQRANMLRLRMTRAEYLCLKMGVSTETAEKLIHEIEGD